MNTKPADIRINETAKRFELAAGEDTAYIDYAWHNEKLALLYVYVPIPFRGKGYSTQLIEYALQYARDRQIKIEVYCSYINRYLRIHPEHHELLES